jgi:hypothetical protein
MTTTSVHHPGSHAERSEARLSRIHSVTSQMLRNGSGSCLAPFGRSAAAGMTEV